MDFNGTTVRPGLVAFIRHVVVIPKIFGGEAPSEEKVAELRKQAEETYDKINTWIGEKDYVAGDSLSLGDLQIFHEVTTNAALMQADLSSYPNVERWYNKCLENPAIKAVNDKFLEGLAALG